MTLEERQKLELIAQQKLEISIKPETNPVEKVLLCHNKFSFLTKCEKQGTTATEAHCCANRAVVIALLKELNNNIIPQTRALFLDMFKKEQEETAKGNYVFYHAQRWTWHFKADIYKQFINLTRANKIGDDYQFLRFNNRPRQNNFYIRDVLFMNGALFGNADATGSCSVHYLLNNHDFSSSSDANLNSDWMTPNFMTYYYRHQDAFNELYQLHNQASRYGNCLLISIPSDKIDTWVYPTSGGAKHKPVNSKYLRWHIGIIKLHIDKYISNTKTIIDTLKTNPDTLVNSDIIEYALTLENDVLDPEKGPRIYAFNCANPTIMAEYYTKKDQLFEIIKKEMAEDNQLQANPS